MPEAELEGGAPGEETSPASPPRRVSPWHLDQERGSVRGCKLHCGEAPGRPDGQAEETGPQDALCPLPGTRARGGPPAGAESSKRGPGGAGAHETLEGGHAQAPRGSFQAGWAAAPGVPGLPAGVQASPGPAGSEGSAHPCPSWGRRPVRAGGRGCRTGSPLIWAMTTAFLLLSGYHWSFRPDWPPRSPRPAGAYLEGRVAPWVVLGERGGSGHREAVGPQGGVWAPPRVSLLIISDLSSE